MIAGWRTRCDSWRTWFPEDWLSQIRRGDLEYSNLGVRTPGAGRDAGFRQPFQEYITGDSTSAGHDQHRLGVHEGPRWPDGAGIPMGERPLRKEPLHDGTFGAMGIDHHGGRFLPVCGLPSRRAWPPRNGPRPRPVRRSTAGRCTGLREVLSVITNSFTLDGTRIRGWRVTVLDRAGTRMRGVIWLRHGGGLPGFGSEHRFRPTTASA